MQRRFELCRRRKEGLLKSFSHVGCSKYQKIKPMQDKRKRNQKRNSAIFHSQRYLQHKPHHARFECRADCLTIWRQLEELRIVGCISKVKHIINYGRVNVQVTLFDLTIRMSAFVCMTACFCTCILVWLYAALHLAKQCLVMITVTWQCERTTELQVYHAGTCC